MQTVERDDIILAILLLLIGVPRVVLALIAERPIGVEGTMAVICAALGLFVLGRRSLHRHA
jgi:hypothetical protein